MLFTVFTPTYNRGYLLDRLFQSLSRQTVRNFDWLIVDDGSTDNTEELVTHFIERADFPIRYMKQKNQGKHIAINCAMNNAAGKYFITIDSDDFLANNCLEICQLLSIETETEKSGGFTFIHAPEEMFSEGNTDDIKKWTQYNTYQWDFAGEMVYVFKLEVIKKYPFPVFENENFCQESVQIIPIIRNYKILFTNHTLAFGNYLEDGLSQNLYARLLENPRYAMLSFRIKLSVAKTREDAKLLARNYWDIALKTKSISWKQKIQGFPGRWSIIILWEKLLKRFNG
ncbi:Glycosyltransferase involved in cell wall bisynthesis [Kaistella treverensis]|uniref:Glycosyltransferase involved in cell wall bisynthesis n=1 Tax=Kaistella treverensis TaxID=631455 RepID=A0A1I3M9U0_9FLAO|nr:glycosyltransferase family 2 protein [Kaistella treverensis]SFI93743.1 Glycosyltransferase involved in cell wall bisynthesis [Kaistella treverensis]